MENRDFLSLPYWIQELWKHAPNYARQAEKEIYRLREALESARISLLCASKQHAFYVGKEVCQYCGTVDDSHHSAVCVKTNLNIVEEALNANKGA